MPDMSIDCVAFDLSFDAFVVEISEVPKIVREYANITLRDEDEVMLDGVLYYYSAEQEKLIKDTEKVWK